MRTVKGIVYEWSNVNQIKNIIHFGAHVGNEIEFYAKLKPETIYWFEPNPELFDELKSNLEKYPNIKNFIFPYAVSAENKKTKFNLIYSDDMKNTGCSSLKELKYHTVQYPHIKKVKEIEVESVKIDDFLTSNGLITDFDLISMDIQGMEYEVLSTSNILFSNKLEQQALIIETSEVEMYEGQKFESDLTKIMKEKGFMKIFYEPLAHNWGDTLYAK
jgi:FkbM family methyltransferase